MFDNGELKYEFAEGVECEEAGEKWRAGDAAKSMRFFVRALEWYSQGLQRYPKNLDLAYNKSVDLIFLALLVFSLARQSHVLWRPPNLSAELESNMRWRPILCLSRN